MKPTDIYCEIVVKNSPLTPYVKHPTIAGQWVQGIPKANAPGTFTALIQNVAPGSYGSTLVCCLDKPSATNTATYAFQGKAVVVPQPVSVVFTIATNVDSSATAAASATYVTVKSS